MLPNSLLVAHKRKGEIQPRYAKLSPENLAVANRLIETYAASVGKKKKALRAFVTQLEKQGYEYRFVRALALLLDRRSMFVCNSELDPATLRRKTFETAEKFGLPTTAQKRQQILEFVASQTGLTPTAIDAQLYADLESELSLTKFDAPAALELLQQYNLSLSQTLLFNCIELTFQTSENWQRLFYTVKKWGLIYEVFQDGDFWVKIDGPASLFKLTKRYGVGIAKLLPVIVDNQEWTVTAKILWKYTNEVCTFKMESAKHSSLLRKPTLRQVTYDSAVEESFASQFRAVRSGWALKREPEPVLAGNQVIIPDFSLERSGHKVYLEIVGFWTEEYLLRKAEKLKQVEVNMILLVNEALACEKLTSLEKRPQLYFIYFRDKISLAPLLCYLQSVFEKVKAKEIGLLKNLSIKFTEPILDYAEFASRIGVSVESVREVFIANPPSDYVAMPNNLVSDEMFKQVASALKDALKQSSRLTLPQAIKTIEALGLSDATPALNYLGYKIKWNGINSEQAEIVPSNGN